MDTRQWIRNAEQAGWVVSAAGGASITLKCSKQGCRNTLATPMESLGATPAPCDWPHIQRYAAPVFDRYRELVGELARRRRSLGLSQEDVGAASGLADGHVNKLEALHRIAQFPTLQLWAETLGMSLTLVPAQLPNATIAEIENRPAPLRATENPKFQKPSLVGE